ncbi:hypothetical protein EYF80_036299 [Liparis tanakae]|uniref:Uncharacterized protein n=1 Tax=Liparis tanakae TaxID=230148 RepID=A0A4Z2GJ90_9TELE|nr:hypothetical protein EYF80_036299 [Liparis tanakae]
MHSAGQSRVQALGQTLPYDQPLGQEGVAKSSPTQRSGSPGVMVHPSRVRSSSHRGGNPAKFEL